MVDGSTGLIEISRRFGKKFARLRRDSSTMSDIAAQARYEQFAELHRGPETFIMPNVWDGPSALLFKEAGFKSIATSSATLAATLGRIDGIHAVTRDEHLEHAPSSRPSVDYRSTATLRTATVRLPKMSGSLSMQPLLAV
jgi:Phosphoenolpyruvate phosphomutase